MQSVNGLYFSRAAKLFLHTEQAVYMYLHRESVLQKNIELLKIMCSDLQPCTGIQVKGTFEYTVPGMFFQALTLLFLSGHHMFCYW